MLYHVYDKDSGFVSQSNKVFDPPPTYEKIMADLGHIWIKQDTARFVAGDRIMEWHGEIVKRPDMPIITSKTTIKCGYNDCIKFTGVPKPVKWRMECMDAIVHQEDMNQDFLEVSVPVPGLYKIIFEQWPYRDMAVEFEAVA